MLNFDPKDILDRFVGEEASKKKFDSQDKETFFSKVLRYFDVLDLKTLWHIVTHLDCASKVFSWSDIAIITGVIVYVVTPFDAIPDFLPGGLVDDVMLVQWLLATYSDLIRKYRETCM